MKHRLLIILNVSLIIGFSSSCITPSTTEESGKKIQIRKKTDKLIAQVEKNFYEELTQACQTHNINPENENLKKITKSFEEIILVLKDNNAQSLINPFVKIKTSKDMKVIPQDKNDNAFKIGYYPVAGDPIHWAHLLTAFQVLAEFKLDKIVYISAGFDESKPNLTHPKIRHPMIKKALKIFENFFVLSDISVLEGQNNEEDLSELSYNGTLRGEVNTFHDLHRNSTLRIDAYYLVGSDHFNWTKKDKQGIERDDTLKILTTSRLKKNLAFNAQNHQIKAVFIARDPKDVSGDRMKEMKSRINFEVSLMKPKLTYSSTQIREAFAHKDSLEINTPFVYLPIRVYKDALTENLYQ